MCLWFHSLTGIKILGRNSRSEKILLKSRFKKQEHTEQLHSSLAFLPGTTTDKFLDCLSRKFSRMLKRWCVNSWSIAYFFKKKDILMNQGDLMFPKEWRRVLGQRVVQWHTDWKIPHRLWKDLQMWASYELHRPLENLDFALGYSLNS